MQAHRKVVHHIKKFHRIRKIKEENLPPWKEKWHNLNEHYLSWLEKIVEKLIPWLVILLLIIILGEFSHQLNFFHWHWMDSVAEFFHHYENIVHIVVQFDQVKNCLCNN